MIFFDTETVGFHGVPVLIQYAIDDGEIYLYEVFRNEIGETLDLIERFMRHPTGIVGFNLTFDMFQLNKIYNIFLKCIEVYGEEAREWWAEDYIEEIASVEKLARDGVCLKPVKVLDLFLHARKTTYQSTLDRKDIRIKRVPKLLAKPLSEEINKRIKFNKLYFARRKEQLENPWQVYDCYEKGDRVNIDPDFKDIVLKFSPSSGLKALAVDAGLVNENDVLKFEDVAVNAIFNPVEVGWAPFAEAIGRPPRPDEMDRVTCWKGTWPAVIKYHISHFAVHKAAREYSRLDIVYTRGLYKFFNCPDTDDNDSVLACGIAAMRWKGFAIDVDGIKALREKALKLERTAPKDPGRVKAWIWPDLNVDEQASTKGSTGKVVLEEMVTWKTDCDCWEEETATASPKCKKCGGKGEHVHPAAIKAKQVLDARKAKKETEIYDKLLQAGRLHASFKIIGALSGRMSGADKLNPQGIKSTKEVRSKFPLAFADEMEELCGGDFESFEVVIAVAVYKDPKLEADLNKYGLCPDCLGKTTIDVKDKLGKKTGELKPCNGCNATGKCKQKVHGLFGEVLYKMTYDEIVSSKGSSKDYYRDSKVGVFSQLYGGNFATLMAKLGLGEQEAKEGSEAWANKYLGIKKAQQRIFNMFCSMRQTGGIGSKIEWHEPHEYIESLLGFRRYFDLENRITRVLFDLAEKPPKEWMNLKVIVKRRDRDQTASGAVRSALFGAAFQIQAANLRAGCNHEIQSTGAGICKDLQRKLWDLQPVGIHAWYIRVMNIHDELMCPCRPEMKPKIREVVNNCLEKYKPIVPMIAIDWCDELETWADK